MDTLELNARTVTIQIELLNSGDSMCNVNLLANGVFLDEYNERVTLVCLSMLRVLLGYWDCYRFVREKSKESVIASHPSHKRKLVIRQVEGGGAEIYWFEREFALTPDERKLWKEQLKSWLKELFIRFGETTLN